MKLIGLDKIVAKNGKQYCNLYLTLHNPRKNGLGEMTNTYFCNYKDEYVDYIGKDVVYTYSEVNPSFLTGITLKKGEEQ